MSDDLTIAPPPERGVHDLVERVDEGVIVVDDDGRAVERSVPWRAFDLLSTMLRRGAVTSEEYAASRRFQRTFRRARLDPLASTDLSKPWVQNGRQSKAINLTMERARREVGETMQVLGGGDSHGGSCVWHVLGYECSLREWALIRSSNGRRINVDAVHMVLITALGVLAGWYGIRGDDEDD